MAWFNATPEPGTAWGTSAPARSLPLAEPSLAVAAFCGGRSTGSQLTPSLHAAAVLLGGGPPGRGSSRTRRRRDQRKRELRILKAVHLERRRDEHFHDESDKALDGDRLFHGDKDLLTGDRPFHGESDKALDKGDKEQQTGDGLVHSGGDKNSNVKVYTTYAVQVSRWHQGAIVDLRADLDLLPAMTRCVVGRLRIKGQGVTRKLKPMDVVWDVTEKTPGQSNFWNDEQDIIGAAVREGITE